MYIGTPRIEIYADRIEMNARAIISLCRAHGIQVACVTKVMSAHPALLRALEAAGADMITDSRITNLQSIANIGSTLPTMMLRSATPSRVADIVRCADYSLNSSAEAMEMLSRAAQLVRHRHKVIVMVDLGDLREGIWPDRVASVIRDSAQLRGIEIVGLGANLACFGGSFPPSRTCRCWSISATLAGKPPACRST
jgi:predicted amino acid racemase